MENFLIDTNELSIDLFIEPRFMHLLLPYRRTENKKDTDILKFFLPMARLVMPIGDQDYESGKHGGMRSEFP
jgi:hypothetical protein